MEFENKVAVITGGASGIGRSVALALAKLGADIVIADIDDLKLAKVRQEIEPFGRHILALRCDVTKDADVQNLASQAISTMGRVDILMNNAGIGMYGDLANMTIANYKTVMEINVLGIIRSVLAFLPHFLKQGKGYIVNTASAAGLNGGAEPYIISKYAAVGYSEGLYTYLRPRGIMVSVLCPGIVNTNLIYNSPLVGSEQEIQEIKSILEKRFTANTALNPDDVAAELIKGMQAHRFLILTSMTESYLANASNRGRDVQKLENYLQSAGKTGVYESPFSKGAPKL